MGKQKHGSPPSVIFIQTRNYEPSCRHLILERSGKSFALSMYSPVYALLQETTAIRRGGNYDRSSVATERTRAWFQCQLIRSSGRFTLKLAHRFGKRRLFNRAAIDGDFAPVSSFSLARCCSVSIIFICRTEIHKSGCIDPIGLVLSDNRINGSSLVRS